MSSFDEEARRWTVQIEAMTREAFGNIASHAHESIQNGSVVTGAPGQPVDTGNLKASWHLEFTSPTTAEISTNVAYAQLNEDGVTASGAPYVQRSPVGGRHSVALTVMNLPKIITFELAKGGR
jgi:Bacteriophage HK97-gp10, putative tail-component